MGAPSGATTSAKLVRELGSRAQKAFVAGDFERALADYSALEPLLETWKGRERETAIARFNLARCLDELNRGAEAITAYERSLKQGLSDTIIAQVKTRIATLEKTALGTLEVRCDALDAVVTVAGVKRSGACNEYWRKLKPGTYQVVARGLYGDVAEGQVSVLAGRSVVLDLTGAISTGNPRRPLAWGLTAGAGALLAGGLVFNVLARSDADDAESFESRGQNASGADRGRFGRQANEAIDAAETNATTSYLLLGAGIAVGAGAIWAWMNDGQVVATQVSPTGALVEVRF